MEADWGNVGVVQNKQVNNREMVRVAVATQVCRGAIVGNTQRRNADQVEKNCWTGGRRGGPCNELADHTPPGERDIEWAEYFEKNKLNDEDKSRVASECLP